MRLILTTALLVAWQILPGSASAEGLKSDTLSLPASGIEVDLPTGIVTRKGISAQCLEAVSKAGPNTLVVSKAPGDDAPSIRVNGILQDLSTAKEGVARIGTIRLTRDGALFHMQTWKTGDKQTELMQDGETRLTWKRGTAVKLLSASESDLVFQVHRSGDSAQLVRHLRDASGVVAQSGDTLLNFGSCVPHRLRLKDETVWARLSCQPPQESGIFRIDLAGKAIGRPLLTNSSADFVSLPRDSRPDSDVTVLTASGTPAALHFFNAVNGLLLAQTGEVRACSSDAEGLQSWNQSYRAMALGTLYAKTKEPAFAELAGKSISLTLEAQDGYNGRNTAQNPACGWSSRIYGGDPDERMSLMINQAMIANGLKRSCDALGAECPATLKADVQRTQICLAEFFEPYFDDSTGLYRIQPDIGFRFAGVIAPWNWQISFAALLSTLPDHVLIQRANEIADRFVSEWSSDEYGALWRYWPTAYYKERGLSPADIDEERFEDTGHAGISLLSLTDFPPLLPEDLKISIRQRQDFLLAAGLESPRDLDGKGPRSTKWFPSGGWASVSSTAFRDAYAGPVPGARSADAVFAYATLFDPEAAFELTLDLHACTDTCSLFKRLHYTSWLQFMKENPFFTVRGHPGTVN